MSRALSYTEKSPRAPPRPCGAVPAGVWLDRSYPSKIEYRQEGTGDMGPVRASTKATRLDWFYNARFRAGTGHRILPPQALTSPPKITHKWRENPLWR